MNLGGQQTPALDELEASRMEGASLPQSRESGSQGVRREIAALNEKRSSPTVYRQAVVDEPLSRIM